MTQQVSFLTKGEMLDAIKSHLNMNKNADFARFLGISSQAVSNWYSRNTFDAELLYTKCGFINPGWLLTGHGSMLKSGEVPLIGDKEAILLAKKNLIPFYDDVSTFGGLNDHVANTDSNSPTEWIDAGDWFPEATAAIRHYGDSMVEYPSGSILALKRVNNPQLIMNGRNYVVETSEYRVTKQLQDDGDHFMAYSTNRDTYPDGRQIHAPFSVPKGEIRYIYLVLGCVTKEYSNGAIPIRK